MYVQFNKHTHTHTYTQTRLLPLAVSTCGEVGPDVHAFMKELAIRRVEHRSATYSNESQHLAEGTEGARLRRRFSFVLLIKQGLSFRPRHHLCRQGVVLASTRQFRSQGLVSVQAHRNEEVNGSEGHEEANGVGGGVGVGGGNGDGNGVVGGNGDVNGHGDGGGAGAGAGTEVEVNERAQDGNGDGSGDGAGTGTGTETEARTVAEMGMGRRMMGQERG